ncbi:MAG: redoxin family protein [Candidatus Eremiobacteraeota bacterium]|nr:redoxin family protein [Candidatus Eremiobacteraeota bacterium]
MKLTRRDVLATAACLTGSLLTRGVASAGVTLQPVLAYGDWLNGRPTAGGLRDKVVLLDVFTFACYNCQNVTPNLRALHRSKSSSDFVIVGVHTPETPYERDRKNVVENLARLGITWPVAVDNDSRLWDAYGIDAWPTQLIFDRSGHLRKTIVGDSQDALVDATIASLLSKGA